MVESKGSEMAVLWFVHEGSEGVRGFPAYQLPIQQIVIKLGGQQNFKFLFPLHKPPATVGTVKSGHVADYGRVVLQLDSMDAKILKWRAGFYEVRHDRSEIVEQLGEPNAADVQQ
jgi:hypothetical protein